MNPRIRASLRKQRLPKGIVKEKKDCMRKEKVRDTGSN